jgi:Ca2+-binding RTX toxin-like protein
VTLTLAAGSGYTIGTTTAVTGTILNDDISSSSTYVMSASDSSLTLTGTAAINGTGNSIDNIIIGNSGNNRITGLLGADTLTGGGLADSDIFAYNFLNESLLGSASMYDQIADFNSNDRIAAPLAVGKARLTTSRGNVSSLTDASIASLLPSSTLAANSAAAFTATGFVGTFLVLNDGSSGFQANTDSIIFLRNYTISSVNFVDFV